MKVIIAILCLTIKVVHPTEKHNIFVIGLICFNMSLRQKTLRGRFVIISCLMKTLDVLYLMWVSTGISTTKLRCVRQNIECTDKH